MFLCFVLSVKRPNTKFCKSFDRVLEQIAFVPRQINRSRTYRIYLAQGRFPWGWQLGNMEFRRGVAMCKVYNCELTDTNVRKADVVLFRHKINMKRTRGKSMRSGLSRRSYHFSFVQYVQIVTCVYLILPYTKLIRTSLLFSCQS